MKNWKLLAFISVLCLMSVVFVSGCLETDNGPPQVAEYHSNFVQSEFDDIDIQKLYEKAEGLGYRSGIYDVSTNITQEQLDSVSPLLQPDICEFNFIEITVPDSEINTDENLSLKISFRDGSIVGDTIAVSIFNNDIHDYAMEGVVSKEWISNILNSTMNLTPSQHQKVINDLCDDKKSAAISRIYSDQGSDQGPEPLIDFVNTIRYLEDRSDKAVGRFYSEGPYTQRSGYGIKYFSEQEYMSDVFLADYVEEGEIGSTFFKVDTLLIGSEVLIDRYGNYPTVAQTIFFINKYGNIGAFIIIHYPEEEVKEEYFSAGRAELREMMENLGFSQETINSIHFGKTSENYGINVTNIANVPL